METLAVLYTHVNYETPKPQLRFQSLKEFIQLFLPSSAWIKLTAIALSLSILTSVASVSATVRRGVSGSYVTSIQQALIRAGHDPGPVDGVYGGMTEYAVIRFQQNQGLNPDGVVGPATASALGLGYSGGGVGSGGIGGGIGGGGGFGVGEVVTIATNGSPLNVRSGPGLDYGVIYTLPFGAVAPVTGRRVGGWIQLADGGWVSSSWVR
jgi:uncharacterized protein YgiM (DUF1202 family)